MIYIDSHAHLTADGVFEQLPALLDRARQAGVGAIMNVCVDLLSLERGLQLSQEYPWIYQAASTTPHDAEKEGELVFDAMAAAARSGRLKAIGETGLDYYYAHSNVAIQKKILRLYLQLALELQLPVIIHCREAFKDFFEILDQDYRTGQAYGPGVLHCFTGTMAEAEQLLNRGWMLSLSGIVTFKKSVDLQEVARQVPLNQLLIETDTPYLAPDGYRGKMNEPAFLVKTAQFIADLRGMEVEELASLTSVNARRLFNF